VALGDALEGVRVSAGDWRPVRWKNATAFAASARKNALRHSRQQYCGSEGDDDSLRTFL